MIEILRKHRCCSNSKDWDELMVCPIDVGPVLCRAVLLLLIIINDQIHDSKEKLFRLLSKWNRSPACLFFSDAWMDRAKNRSDSHETNLVSSSRSARRFSFVAVSFWPRWAATTAFWACYEPPRKPNRRRRPLFPDLRRLSSSRQRFVWAQTRTDGWLRRASATLTRLFAWACAL